MSKRICDSCGKEKKLKGGKTCDNGHFICKDCVYENWNIITGGKRKQCPLCNKPIK